MSTTPGNLLEFKNPPGNPGNLLEFVRSSWKFLYKMSMIDHIGFWIPDRLYKKLVTLLCFCHGPMLCISCFYYYIFKTIVDLVHCIAGQSNANISWIFLEIPPGNLLEICLVRFVDILLRSLNVLLQLSLVRLMYHRHSNYSILSMFDSRPDTNSCGSVSLTLVMCGLWVGWLWIVSETVYLFTV